jgi:hypothetical protein
VRQPQTFDETERDLLEGGGCGTLHRKAVLRNKFGIYSHHPPAVQNNTSGNIEFVKIVVTYYDAAGVVTKWQLKFKKSHSD